MKRELSNCIALGVGTGRVEEAADFYERFFGFARHQVSKEWVEMRSGPLRLFLVGDEHGTPTFDFSVEDVEKAMADLTAAGCEEVELNTGADERFVRDPYGMYFCVSPQTP